MYLIVPLNLVDVWDSGHFAIAWTAHMYTYRFKRLVKIQKIFLKKGSNCNKQHTVNMIPYLHGCIRSFEMSRKLLITFLCHLIPFN